MIYVIATSEIKPENHEAYTAGVKPHIAATRKEAGCIYYDVHVALSDPNCFVTVERWESQEALDAHLQTDGVKAWREFAKPLRSSVTVEFIDPASVKKL
jgi:quinol monooxygenase YgiN